jgi:single-stranded-DNA-specific exonuclease
LYDYRLVGNDRHLKCTFTVDGGLVDGIGFGLAGLATGLPHGGLVDVCYTLHEDYWNGERRMQLRLVDIRPTQEPR